MNGTRTPAPASPGEVADILTQRIRTGVLKAGDRMPTQESLADEFGVERAAIRQALRLLEEAGLLTGRTRGAPARIAEHPSGVAEAAAGEPQKTAAVLGSRLMAAFGAPHVSIDAVCLTAESLNLALAEPLQLIRAGRITPATVKVRLLLPARNLHLAFPRPAEKSGDEKLVHEHWLSLRNSHGAVLRHSLRVLHSTRSIDVEVTLKALPFTPTTKLYLLNGSEALFAYYTIKSREEQIDDTPMKIYDSLGSDSMIFRFERGGGKRDEAFVTQSQAWFDGLWETIATKIALDG